MNPRAVLFDLHQTLLYVEPTGTRALAAQAVGAVGISAEDWRAAWVSTLDRSDRGEAATILERVHMSMTAAGVDDADPALTERLAGLLLVSEYPLLYPDTRGALAQLRARGCRLALVSNTSAYRRNWLSEFALERLFDSVVLSFEVGMLKPEPEIYRLAADRLSVPPQECVFVDDQPKCLAGAHAISMTTVWIDRSNREDHPRGDASRDLRVENLDELIAWLPERAGEPAEGTPQP
jgi:putative hydrolase of the HAD superfamily